MVWLNLALQDWETKHMQVIAVNLSTKVCLIFWVISISFLIPPVSPKPGVSIIWITVTSGAFIL